MFAANHPAHHHKNTQGLRVVDEAPQRVGPCRRLTPLFHIEPEGVSQARAR